MSSATPLNKQTYCDYREWDSTAFYTFSSLPGLILIPVVTRNGTKWSMTNGQAAIGGAPGVDTAWESFAGQETSIAPVYLATTANITLSGEQTIDGVLTTTSRVLVHNQTNAAQNGIYTTGSGAWTRPSDVNTWAQFVGATVQVIAGTLQGGFIYTSNAAPGGTLGTTLLTFTHSETLYIAPKVVVFNSTSPGAANDQTQNYTVGSTWWVTSTGKGWFASSVATGAAVWTPIVSNS